MTIIQRDIHGKAKLDEIKVRGIKLMLDRPGYTKAKIAKAYNISPPTISHISSGRTWAHVGVPQ